MTNLQLLNPPTDQTEYTNELRYAISRIEFFSTIEACKTLAVTYANDIVILKANYPEFQI